MVGCEGATIRIYKGLLLFTGTTGLPQSSLLLVPPATTQIFLGNAPHDTLRNATERSRIKGQPVHFLEQVHFHILDFTQVLLFTGARPESQDGPLILQLFQKHLVFILIVRVGRAVILFAHRYLLG